MPRTEQLAPAKPFPKERVLIEFPQPLIKQADAEASRMGISRSQLIRTALEEKLAMREKARLEAELAEAYAANSGRNLELLEEFSAVDREIFE
jgi:metal-responsive CopG/Arc/MetJ family transcriptional regulator